MQSQSGIQWSHSHNFGIDTRHQFKKVMAVFWLTTIVMVLEISAGIWSGSMALLADGWHMGTHSAAFSIAIFAYWYANKHASNKAFSFGTGKVTYLGGFASAVALVIVALIMLVESVHRFIEPQNIRFNEAIVVAIIGLVVNIISVFILHDDHHHHDHLQEAHHGDHGQHKHHDHNIKAAYFHVLADTLTSLLAIIALLAGKFFGLIWMDSLMGIVGAIVISRWSYGLIKESSAVLLDKTDVSLSTSSIDKIVETFKTHNQTVINDIHIWKIAPAHQAAILSVSAQSPLLVDEYKQLLKQCLPRLSHISIEINRV